ncbi:probable enoyl-CoA hydratase [Tribolium castaneum]|uniref:Carnitinyl-CoA dehydratase-like Protein n=1 Tax=Tribolium castaneum TaxID=7070 RepID=D6W8S7_TRICA|nr:PREDICTED: probable enoyl-CoA hydratase [Tribolium castaneum]EEZ98266.1 Carnitinyl-CoA dehydratase-like Protein [Tribolium castaneum]|eukprot:XP_974775.1 PREDICTED: probable enoyl-CoA hydratase [Tribolium castaneum]
MVTRIPSVVIRHYSNSPKTVLTEKIGEIVTIGLNRPEKRNCIDPSTADLLREAIEDFENDNTLKAAVLYGTGGNFCAGYDLKSLSKVDETQIALNPEGQIGPTLRFIKKPMVAAISGYAVAGGLELALMCDLRVMEDTAVMGVYCRRFGVPLVDGGTVRLQAMVGLSRALDLILTGRSLSAKEAFEWGVANRIVACGTALGQAIQLANSLVKFPQECLLTDRNSTYNAAFSSAYLDLLKYEQENGVKVVRTESIAGAKRFAEGFGRHGKSTNLKVPELKDWEREFETKSKL